MNNKLFLTESEKLRISSLHRKAIINEGKNVLNEATLTDIQNLLKDKGLDLGPKGVDGKIGPFTLNAIYSALTQTQGTTPQQDNKIHNAQVVGAPNEADLQKTTPTMINNMINGQPATGTQNPSGTTPTNNTTPTTPSSTTKEPTTSTTTPTTNPTAPGQPRTGQEIRQDFKQQKQQGRETARQGRKNVQQLEKELQTLQANYRRLGNKMSPTDKQSYESRINQIQIELGNA